jgi:ATP synthase protein I
MSDEQRMSVSSDETTFSRQVGAQAARKLRARRFAPKSVWFGLGMSGVIGWSVAIPTLIGAALGIWVDRRFPSPFSWTLMCLFMGLIVGCLNAWLWVRTEYQDMQEGPDE